MTNWAKRLLDEKCVKRILDILSVETFSETILGSCIGWKGDKKVLGSSIGWKILWKDSWVFYYVKHCVKSFLGLRWKIWWKDSWVMYWIKTTVKRLLGCVLGKNCLKKIDLPPCYASSQCGDDTARNRGRTFETVTCSSTYVYVDKSVSLKSFRVLDVGFVS